MQIYHTTRGREEERGDHSRVSSKLIWYLKADWGGAKLGTVAVINLRHLTFGWQWIGDGARRKPERKRIRKCQSMWKHLPMFAEQMG